MHNALIGKQCLLLLKTKYEVEKPHPEQKLYVFHSNSKLNLYAQFAIFQFIIPIVCYKCKSSIYTTKSQLENYYITIEIQTAPHHIFERDEKQWCVFVWVLFRLFLYTHVHLLIKIVLILKAWTLYLPIPANTIIILFITHKNRS